VASIIEGTFKPAALAQLVSSQLDVDRMDYLLRDSLMTGAKYGLYDLEWIINALQIDEQGDRIYVAARGVFAVEEYLQARYYMFRQVYFHRTLRSAEAVLRSALRRALELMERGDEVWCAPGASFEKVLQRRPLSISEHLEIDDSDVIFHLKQWQRSGDQVLSDLSSRFVGRRLFKAIDLDMPLNERAQFLEAARAIVAQAGFAPQFYFIEDRASDVPYYGFYTGDSADPRKRIYVEDGYARPRIREISEISEAVRALQRGYELHRICFPAEVKAEVYRLYHGAASGKAAKSV
jgi:HD superfamily phosphohydrolase